MEQNEKVELLSLAIQRLTQDETIEESPNGSADDSDPGREHHRHRLSRLLSVMEELKGGGSTEQSEVSNLPEEAHSVTSQAETKNDPNGNRDEEAGKTEPDEVTKELKRIKRQNFITHCLLSAMIVLTLSWQISEVSLIFTLKERLTHPFRHAGRMFVGMLRGPDPNGDDADKNSSRAKQDSSLMAAIQTPEMPNMMQE